MKPHSSPIALIALITFLNGGVSLAGLVAHWKFDEGSGTLAADSTANSRDGTISTTGATWVTSDLPPVPAGTAAALDLDGTAGQIDILGYKGISGTGDRSITAWIRTRQTTPAQNKGIVSWGENLGAAKWTFRIQNSNGIAGAIRIEVNGGYLVGNTVVTDGAWHHVAVTWANDGTPDVLDAKLYVDGVLDAEFGSIDVPPSASQSQAINTAATADVRIGQDFQAAHNWDGWIDDVRIYDHAVDAATITALATGTPIITRFEADAEIVASGTPVVLSWLSDPTNDSLALDNGIGDVLGSTMFTVNPTADTTFTLTGTRGGTTLEREVTVLVEKPPVIGAYAVIGTPTILAGASARLAWDVFGEASLALNGSDVSGQQEATVSPTETTTFTLSATNAWGTRTAEVTITVLSGDNPDLSWSAAGLPDGNLTTWTPAINATGNNGIVFNNATGGTVQSGLSNFAAITEWVNSPGFNMASNPNDSFQDGLGDAATKVNVSWELVFRPGDFSGFHVLFNTGGNGLGTAITLNGSVLDFRFQAADSDAQRVTISTDLANLGAATDFYHVIALADVESAASGTGWLYVNGVLAAGPTTSTGTINDWDGGDLAELGKGNNIPNGNPSNAAAFTGDIALFNYYGGRLLSEQAIGAAYATVLGGGEGEFAVTAIIYDAAQQQLRLTFNSSPVGIYSVWQSKDLTSWLELNDFILSQGTETTYEINGVTLPDTAIPQTYYQFRLTDQ